MLLYASSRSLRYPLRLECDGRSPPPSLSLLGLPRSPELNYAPSQCGYSFSPEVNPASLALAGDQSCLPVVCTPDYAIFKFPVTGCGTRTFVVGETRVYLAEVQSLIQRRQWTYGLVTSDRPFSLLVECRYSKGNVASTGFLVKTPTALRPAPHLGVFQVQLQIAKDGTFSQFYPSSSLPVSLLLGSRVYLELRLINPTDPSLVLLVHYCIAYPRSSSAVWVLLYQGCPNVLDYGSSASLHVDGQPPHTKFRRRFSLRIFQFLSSGLALDEEISFMCSTEVCSPDQRVCNEGCFDGRGELYNGSNSFRKGPALSQDSVDWVHTCVGVKGNTVLCVLRSSW
ncbi:UNVERIFIED_CONTAM: hypothetical protein FKN15_074108 [Acipenser sinensis]